MVDPCILRSLRTGGTADGSRSGEVGSCNNCSFGPGARAFAQVWTSVPPSGGLCGREESVQETHRIGRRSGARSIQGRSRIAHTNQLECGDFNHSSVFQVLTWTGGLLHGVIIPEVLLSRVPLLSRHLTHILPSSRSFKIVTSVYIWS